VVAQEFVTMLDFVLVVFVLLMTAVTLAYMVGCGYLLRHDSTRDVATTDQTGGQNQPAG
jgi:hypothetical protein